MICLTRHSWPPTATIVNFMDSDEAVILILDTASAVKIANDQWEAYGSFPKRLPTNHATLTRTGELWIPMVHVNWDGTPEFSDGRHRTLTLHNLGYTTVPVLASRKTADALQHIWGSISVARAEYQFPESQVTTFIGR